MKKNCTQLHQIYQYCAKLLAQAKMITDCQDGQYLQMQLSHFHYCSLSAQKKNLRYDISAQIDPLTDAPMIQRYHQQQRRNILADSPSYLTLECVGVIQSTITHEMQIQVYHAGFNFERLMSLQRSVLSLVRHVYAGLQQLATDPERADMHLNRLKSQIQHPDLLQRFGQSFDTRATHFERLYRELSELVLSLELGELRVPAEHADMLQYLDSVIRVFEALLSTNKQQRLFEFTPINNKVFDDQFLAQACGRLKPRKILFMSLGFAKQDLLAVLRDTVAHYNQKLQAGQQPFQSLCRALNFFFQFLLKAQIILCNQNPKRVDMIAELIEFAERKIDAQMLAAVEKSRYKAIMYDLMPQHVAHQY